MLVFALVNLLGLLGYGLGWLLGTLARKRKAVVLAGAALVLVLLVAKTVLMWKPVWEATLFPVPWYVFLQGYWPAFIGLVFFGFVTPQLPVVWNRWVLAAVALWVFAGGVRDTWWIPHPQQHGEPLTADAHFHRTQTTGYTCAPCACVCALAHVGISATEREMAGLCLTRKDEGSTQFNTFRALLLKLEGTPWRPRMVALPAEALLAPGTIAVIDWPQLRHAITVVGEGDHVLVHDPLVDEPKPWTLAKLRARYGDVAIVLERR